jgi:hypothetical protein
MTAFYGADVAELRNLARVFEQASTDIEQAKSLVSRGVETSFWVGPVAVRFRSNWRNQHTVALGNACGLLTDAVRSLGANADEQDRASNSQASTFAARTRNNGAILGNTPADQNASDFTQVEVDSNGTVVKYKLGNPKEPKIEWDNDFKWNSANPGLRDYATWKIAWEGSKFASTIGMDDAEDMYRHFLGNSGEDRKFNLAEAISEDSSIRDNTNAEIARAQQAAEQFIANGKTEFSFTGGASGCDDYPVTENWQKTIGGYQQWSSAEVKVDGDQVAMVVTVHAEDHYNFNKNQADIASGLPDEVNGHLEEVGLARSFDSHGTVVRTVTWTIGDPENVVIENSRDGIRADVSDGERGGNIDGER